MVEYNTLHLPSSQELPDSDDTPVDNELQDLIPALLRAILSIIWSDRQDWFMACDMGIYYDLDNPRVPIVPDGFLSIGVPKRKGSSGRRSYVLWEEDFIAPIVVIEQVSHAYGGEYDQKMQKYIKLGALYYVIYNPDFYRRDQHEPFEVYKLIDGKYVLQSGEPVWLPELNLGIGRADGVFENWQREWLFWYDENGNRYPSPPELLQMEQNQKDLAQLQLEQKQQQLEQEQQRSQRLQDKLRELGIDPNNL
jgi:Uma2 family endonuclease